ncbi:TLD-domain-containing protein [Rozella allomycis CSF55]|uniref:MTOR-associated protein MEAK7 n=1 Tax=Rozella allomycis (strain CSF55) TaxID=988480 RepID=A0A075B3H2_ROZAC|nr:TLDc domain-containing protein [Rozella allomycis CSF55]RKP21778.1 TLD-domain-containing protein [Rozella allomycis CSF55]|eukprot:EPZ35383.1 TLDc domain-containing protein [Rozella allomycis CSF55]
MGNSTSSSNNEPDYTTITKTEAKILETIHINAFDRAHSQDPLKQDVFDELIEIGQGNVKNGVYFVLKNIEYTQRFLKNISVKRNSDEYNILIEIIGTAHLQESAKVTKLIKSHCEKKEFSLVIENACVAKIFHSSLFLFLDVPMSLVDEYLGIPELSRESTLMDKFSILGISTHLRPEYRNKWQRTFLSERDGKSWIQFVNSLRGSTIIVVKDSKGYIFGGFTCDIWKMNPNFYGSGDGFLFQLHPELKVFKPTGINNNFMYLNYNKQSLPNGIGFGGQFHYFGLWIESSFESGHSKANPKSTTYGNSRLSCEENFQIDVVEVWCTNDSAETESESPQQSAMVKHSEELNFLELANRPRYHDYEEND